MDRNKKNTSSSAIGAGLLGAAVGILGTLIYKAFDSSSDTNNNNNQNKTQSPQPPVHIQVPVQVNQTKQQEQNENIFCPITFVPMTDPYIITTCGHSFQKEAIDDCLNKRSECPVCRKTCTKNDIIPNYQLKSLVEDLVKQQK